MKKTLLFSLLIVFSVSLFAQMRPALPKGTRLMTKAEIGALVSYPKTYKDITTYGDTIVYDDFGTGGPAPNNLPTGWTTQDVDTEGNNYVWQWTDVGATGPTTAGYEIVLASTSAANGWMILDSDNYGLGSYDAQLISPTYDLSAEPSVAVVFEELYQRWGNEAANPYGANPTFVGVSADGGTTWTDIEIHANFEIKETTDNPGLIMINVTALVANQSAVKIRFRMQGYWDYWWQIDDFRLIVAPDYNSELVATYVSQVGNYTAGLGLTGYHSLIPMSQAMDTWFEGDVWNNGNQTLHNVTFTVDVTDGGGSSVYNASNDTVILPFDSTKALVIQPPYFTAPGADTYTAHFSCSQTEPDEVPENNTKPDISFTFTGNEIFAHDVSFTRAISPEFYTDGTDGDMMGCTYHIENSTTVMSISVFIDYRTDPGTTIIGQIYAWDGTAWNVQIVSEEHTIVYEDLGTWIELPLIAYNPGEDALNAQSDYIAGCEFYYGTQRLWIGADDEGPHLYNLETNLRIGTTYYWIHELPMIRLNLADAIVPPVFTTYPDTFTCRSPFVYEYTAHVTDPGGATCSFTLVQSPNWLTLVDNNNNSATLTGTAPTTVTGQSFLIEIEADNGTSKNQQWYVLDVLNSDTCTNAIDPVFMNPVTIFPNPTNDIINISNARNSNIYVYNIVGELVTSVLNAEAFTSIDMKGYSNGTYMVKVVAGEAVISQKITLIK